MNVNFPQGPQSFPEPSIGGGSSSLFESLHRAEQAIQEHQSAEQRLSIALEWLRAIAKQYPITREVVNTALQELQ